MLLSWVQVMQVRAAGLACRRAGGMGQAQCSQVPAGSRSTAASLWASCLWTCWTSEVTWDLSEAIVAPSGSSSAWESREAAITCESRRSGWQAGGALLVVAPPAGLELPPSVHRATVPTAVVLTTSLGGRPT